MVEACNSNKKRLKYLCFPVKFAKVLRTPFFIEQQQWLLLRVFKGVQDKNGCDCLQYLPDLAGKGVCCRENPEAATVGVLEKKACNFIEKRLQYCEIFKNTYLEKHL